MNSRNVGLSILLASSSAIAQGPSATPSSAAVSSASMEFEPIYVGTPASVAPSAAPSAPVSSSAPASMIPSAPASVAPKVAIPISAPASVIAPVVPSAPASVVAPITPSAPVQYNSPVKPIVPSSAVPGVPGIQKPVVRPIIPSTDRATTLDETFSERDHIFGENTTMQPRGSTMFGTVAQNDVGQQTRVGVLGREGFELALEHFRDPNNADILSLGAITPAVYHLSLLGTVSMLTDQNRNDGTVLARYEPVANALVRGGLLYVDSDKHALVGGQYVGRRLGGFVFNIDAIANVETQDNALGRGVLGFARKNWYFSAGGNTTGLGSSTQGWLPNYDGKNRADARFGVVNRVWYSDKGDQGMHLIAGPALSLEPTDVVDLDSRSLGVGGLGVLQGWERFTPNYAGGSVLFEVLFERNEDLETSTYGGMVYKQVATSNNTGEENHFFGAGLARNKVESCKEWMFAFDESSSFLDTFTQRATVKINPETYRGEVIFFLGSARMW